MLGNKQNNKGLRCLFFVQGEGCGQMTLAISLQQILEKSGHEVCAVIVGVNNSRKIPEFFLNSFENEIISLESPVKEKSIGSVLNNFINRNRYKKSINKIDQVVKKQNPDVIVNFHEILCGRYYKIYTPKIPQICIGHQYLYLHPDYVFPDNKRTAKNCLLKYTRETCFNADQILALSYREMRDVEDESLFVLPPLLRKEVFNLSAVERSRILVYLANKNNSSEIIEWHKRNNTTEIHCFWDNPEKPGEWEVHKNLIFHNLDSKKYLEILRTCSGLMTTAGFEAVVEGIYKNKPVFLVSDKNHYEQQCNTNNALQEGKVGISRNKFNIPLFIQFIQDFHFNNKAFKAWVDSGYLRFEDYFSSLDAYMKIKTITRK